MTHTTDALVEGLRPWIETESPTAEPAAVNAMMDLAQGSLLGAGAHVERITGRDGAGDHLSARMPWGGEGDGKGILILCHLDTVHPLGTLARLPFRAEGDRLFGPGTADMKGGVFIAVEAARAVGAAGTGAMPVTFLITSDEETGSATSREHIEKAAAGAAYVLVTEPGRGNGAVVTARKGVSHYTLTTEGRAAHAGTAHHKGRSAIREMARLVLACEAMTDYERGLTLNIGEIRGGSVINTVPQYCTAGLDVRVEDDATQAEVHERLLALRPEDPEVTFTLSGGPNRPAYRKEPAIEALYGHAKALADEIGIPLPDVATGGGSDGSFVAQSVPTLDGLGVMGADAHTLHEHLFVSSMAPRMTLLRRLMETLR